MGDFKIPKGHFEINWPLSNAGNFSLDLKKNEYGELKINDIISDVNLSPICFSFIDVWKENILLTNKDLKQIFANTKNKIKQNKNRQVTI